MSHDILLASPIIALCLGAIVVLLLDAFVPSRWSRSWAAGLSVVVSFALLLNEGRSYMPGATLFTSALYADPLFFYGSSLLLAGVFICLILAAALPTDDSLEQPAEFYSLLLFSTAGALIFSAAAELLTFFVGLELMSLSLYCLCGASRFSRFSTESALKYFIMGSFSSAILLFGIALIYGLTGTTSIQEIGVEIGQIDNALAYCAITFFFVGLIFKIGGVPFHFWVPDVYEGAPTCVTAYMASVVKGASVLAAMRIFWSAFGDVQFFISNLLVLVAVLTMAAGNLIALGQKNIKRLLAYSSIAHVGYLILGLLALRHGDAFGGGAALLYYIAAYGLASIGAFGVLHGMAATGCRGFDIASFSGLSKKQPLLAAVMAIFLFSLAGLPPGMAGLIGKVYLFYSAVAAGHAYLVVGAVLASAVSLYYYLRIVMYMYFLPPEEGDLGAFPERSLPVILVLSALAVVVLGIFPSWLYQFASTVLQEF